MSLDDGPCAAEPGNHKVILHAQGQPGGMVRIAMWPACDPNAIVFASFTAEQCKQIALNLLDEADVAVAMVDRG